jgi:hypothetical protein
MIGPFEHRGERYVLRLWWERPHPERKPCELVRAHAALQSWVRESSIGHELRMFLIQADGHPSPVSDDALVPLIITGLEQRRFAVDVLEARAMPAMIPRTREPVETQREEPAERDWIGVELADVDGNLIRHAQLDVELPDGTVRTVVTDERGRFELHGIAPGSSSTASRRGTARSRSRDCRAWKTRRASRRCRRAEGMSRITRRELGEVYDRNTGRLHHFTLREFFGYVLEVDDVHFHFDSAVFLPDHEVDHPDDPGAHLDPSSAAEPEGTGEDTGELPEDTKITGLAVIRSIYLHAKENASQKLLITGHTDTSGPKAYNLELSGLRADNFKHVLLGNKDEWVAICEKKHKPRDVQQILTWIARVWAADCDPGGIDGDFLSRSKAALKKFKKMYNEEFEASIAVDDKIDAEMWGAFFDIYMEVLADILDVDVDQLAAERARLKFVDDGKQAVGCGEHFPIDLPGTNGRKSASNRRVQALFFDPGEQPLLDCHPSATECVPEECEIYEKRHHFFLPLDPTPAPLLPRYKIELDLGDIDAVMTPIESETHTDTGVRERLQAIGWFYTSLGHTAAELDARAEFAWSHFKEETGKADDASAVAELRRLVKEHIVDGGRLPAKGEQTKLRMPGTWCVTPTRRSAWSGDSAGDLFQEEQTIYNNNMSIGRVPIRATVEAKFRRKFKPAGGVTVHFQFVEPDPIPAGHALAPEPLRAKTLSPKVDIPSKALKDVTLRMTGHPDKYIAEQRALHPPTAGDPFVDNVHKDRGGKRGGNIVGIMPSDGLLEAGWRPWFHTDLGYHHLTKSPHPHAGKVDTNDKGEAVAIFMPSQQGGDRFRFRAFLDPLRRKASSGREKTAVFKESGTFVIWRTVRIAQYKKWDYPAGTTAAQRKRCGGTLRDIDMSKLVKELKRAWIETTIESKAGSPQLVSAAEYTAAIRYARARIKPALTKPYDLNVLIDDQGTSPGFVNYRTPAEYDAAPKGPPPPGRAAWPRAVLDLQFWTNLNAIAKLMHREVIQYFSRDAIGGMTVLQAPSASRFEADPQVGMPADNEWDFSGQANAHRGCWVVLGEDSYKNLRHDQSGTFVHEAGHVLYGPHQHTNAVTVVDKVSNGELDSHDYTDLCVMAYVPSNDDYCGRCILRIAGWDTSKLRTNRPADELMKPSL